MSGASQNTEMGDAVLRVTTVLKSTDIGMAITTQAVHCRRLLRERRESSKGAQSTVQYIPSLLIYDLSLGRNLKDGFLVGGGGKEWVQGSGPCPEISK